MISSCKKDDHLVELDAETTSLVQSLEQELVPLPENPLLWKNEDLKFLDPYAQKPMVGLGEATHGTAEFFDAKYRIFKYLVENHGYKVFAFEADFGESMLINEAVQEGSKSKIANLMRTRMHFWTWKTMEVKRLLEWMCEYNVGKPAEEKVQYVGVDCQYNTYHPGMLRAYLAAVNASFSSFAEEVLREAETATKDGFGSYSETSFQNYLEKIEALQDSLLTYKDRFIEAGSEREYQLHAQLLRVIKQTSEVGYYRREKGNSVNYRDLYMAENAIWWQKHLAEKKMVLWAHNGHIADLPHYGTGSMGHHLRKDLADKYAIVGFLFSRGSFTAYGVEGEQSTGLAQQVLNAAPIENSLNAILSHAREPVFSVKIADLQKHPEWNKAFSKDMRALQIGAVYNQNPKDYYADFRPSYFDQLIYFDNSSASVLLK